MATAIPPRRAETTQGSSRPAPARHEFSMWIDIANLLKLKD
jgi:hypothetical protein